MGNHAVNSETESAVSSKIVIPLIAAYDNETDRLMEGDSIEARVGHTQEDSVIKVGAYTIIKNKDGKIERRPIKKSDNERIH